MGDPGGGDAAAAALTLRWRLADGSGTTAADGAPGGITLYLNGQAQTVEHTHSAPYAAGGPVVIGRSWYQTYSSNPFAGSLADFRVYNRVLSAAEVHSLLSAS